MGRIRVALEVKRAAVVLGESRLVGPDRIPCFSIAGRTSDAISVVNAEQRESAFSSRWVEKANLTSRTRRAKDYLPRLRWGGRFVKDPSPPFKQ
jgi:hypothetical protein